MGSRGAGGLLLIVCVASTSGCVVRTRPDAAPLNPPIEDRTIVLNDHAQRLHFSRGTRAVDRPLLVYATGDGGWHRKDLALFHQLVSFGYPTVGFDAHDYVTHLGPRDSTTPARLAGDYERIIAEAKETLALPADYPVVLVGVSRGAGLSVVAAGQRGLRPSIAGVLAVALTKEEEYVKRFRPLRGRGRLASGPEMVEVYAYLPRLAAMPIAVVQSTRDDYLPAAAARALFGPDNPHRWFQSIQARNHSFGGARPQLYEAMSRSLTWIDGLLRTAR
jgi:virulence protein VirJ